MALLTPFPQQIHRLRRSIEAHVPRKVMRDLANRLRYGPQAPLSDECLWVDPREITLSYRADPSAGAPAFRRHASGLVRGGDWDLSRRPLGSHIKHIACVAHFRDGVPWEETGLYEEMLVQIGRHGSYDGLRSFADIERRYAALDALAQEARLTGRLKARRELDGKFFRREHGGVMVHIARDGTLLRAGGGMHRFALAQALELPLIPAQIGVVHPAALDAGVLPALRQPPADYAPAAAEAGA